MPADLRPIGSPLDLGRDCFHSRARSPADRSPGSLRPRFILPWSRASSEFLLFKARSLSFDDEHHLPGFLPSSRHDQAASTCRAGYPPTLRSVLRLSQPLDGLLRHLTPPACFIRQPSPGFVSFRGFSLRAATLARREQLPPCRCPPPAQRPRAMAAVGLLDYEVFIHTKKRFAGLVLPAPLFAPLFEFVLLQVTPARRTLQLPKAIRPCRCPRIVHLPEEGSLHFVDFDVFMTSNLTDSSPLRSSCSRFRACRCHPG